METIRFGGPSRFVIASRNDANSKWSARLYVNLGETATQTARKFSTIEQAERWADKLLQEPVWAVVQLEGRP